MAEYKGKERERSGFELEEDLLERIYSDADEKGSISIDELLSNTNMTAFETERILGALEQRNEITGIGEKDGEKPEVLLTEKGKSRALYILNKREYLTSFLQMVCNVDEATARTDAHRIEHVASHEVIEGMRNFVRDRRVSARTITNKDLSFLLEPGDYVFDMGLYDSNIHSPRKYCPENDCFSRSISVKVGKESWFRFEMKDDCPSMSMWYRNGTKWRKARKDGRYLYISSSSFEYTVSGSLPVLEADGYAVFPKQGESFSENEIRSINIHLW